MLSDTYIACLVKEYLLSWITMRSAVEYVLYMCVYVRGKVNNYVTNRDWKETNGDNDIPTIFIFQRNLHTNLNTCPAVLQVSGNLRRKVLVVAVGTTRTLFFEPRHRQEGVPPKDVVLEGYLTWQAMFAVHGQHFFVDTLCYHIFRPQKPHISTLFYRGARIQGRRHLVTGAPFLQACAYRSLRVTIKLDSAAI